MKRPLIIGALIIANFFAVANCLECYTCKSSTDIDCARNPGKQIEVQECRNDNECVTAIVVNGTTQRGCLSDVFPNKYCTLCEKCNTSLCNVRIYPADRLRCYECLGSSCIDIQNSTFYKPVVCGVYKENDRCYTNVISQETVRRGCEAADIDKLGSCPNICLKCNYDGCNTEIGVTHHNCLACSFIQSLSPPDYACLRNQEESTDQCAISGSKTCYNKVLLGHKGKCFTLRNEQTNVITRGCSSAMGSTINGNLTECYGEYCNSDCANISCNICDTTINPACRNQTNSLKSEKCDSNSCFSCEDGMHLWRGCGSDIPQPRTNQICYQCRDANGCNRQSIRSCYKCSSINDPECANWMDISNITASNCTHRDEKCVTTLVSRLNLVYTLRGCASQVSECTESDPFCERCEGSLCNDGPKIWNADINIGKYRRWLRSYIMPRNASGYMKISFFYWCILVLRLVI
ncbi:uncharacterized protein LOC129907216 [Episyrphus balteatus]|uniref:uncharacterized protein LOC129907216 n=1 Tax=Episyrphus balteatus TaxID=286459 RepID=UPI00248667BE|nr:uncharacterized protein LOC129907216 [Episyrphus balteatus]